MKNWNCLVDQGKETRSNGTVRSRQESWLRDCLRRNQFSDYLVSHGVDRHTSPDAFRQRLPLINYDNLVPYIEQIEQGKANVLFDGSPMAFERTGGSTGGNKLIPYTTHNLSDFRAAILPWLSEVIEMNGIESGAAYWAISPATRSLETTSTGIPVGLPDGSYLGEAVLPSFVALSAVPPWVGSIPDVDEWQLATVYWLVCRDDLVLISVWSPTFFLMLLDVLDEKSAELSELLRHGGTVYGHSLPANGEAAQRFEIFLGGRDTRVVWPSLRVVSCWADASSRPFFNELKLRLPHAQFQGKGLLATEGVTTVPAYGGCPVLAADSGFFEFLDEQGAAWFAWELRDGKQYEVVMTTSGGLYRYRTGDLVKCEGYADGLPEIRFVGRQGLASDLVGEKLTEQFVASCLEDIPGFRMLVPHTQAKPKYILVLDRRNSLDAEMLADIVEERLSKNVQYAYARRLGQLDSLSVQLVKNPLGLFLKKMTDKGVRLGDIKIPSLRPETDWLTAFMEHKQ